MFDDTETETPSRTPTRTATATNTPTSTATSTSTPAPSPSATHPTMPSPTSTRPATATARHSTTTTSQQTSTLVNVAAGANQTLVASPVSTNKQNSQANQGAIPTGNTFPVLPLSICLGSLFLLGLLLKGWRGILRRPSSHARLPKLPTGGQVRTSNQRDAIIAQRAHNLSVPWDGVLTRDQFAQAVQRRVMNVNGPPPLTPVSNFGNTTPYPTATTNASFYTYPGIRRPGDFITPGGSPPAGVHTMPTVASVPVPNPPAVETPAPVERSTDGLEVSNPSLRSWVQTYIY